MANSLEPEPKAAKLTNSSLFRSVPQNLTTLSLMRATGVFGWYYVSVEINRRKRKERKEIPAVRVVLVSSDDWQGLYVDGVLVCENHSLKARDILQAMEQLGIGFGEVWIGGSRMEEMGRLPDNLADLPADGD